MMFARIFEGVRQLTLSSNRTLVAHQRTLVSRTMALKKTLRFFRP
ncbi:MAG TPA: hypothetical protein VNP04_28160 [Alphaproteobacteria bacterium]|nr:hypothetical protein [Alphaproteobacteria bacterium]